MIGKDVPYAAQLLQAGEVIGMPTETVYGLAGNALNDAAVSRIFAVKNRPNFDPLIIHTSSLDRISQWTQALPNALQQLAEAFMPGPLTLLLPKRPCISDLVTAGSPLVAVRIPAHPLTSELLTQLDFPVAAPSANPFGYISPTTAQHVAQQLGEKIPYILDGGPCHFGLESTIVGMERGKACVYRKGGLSIERIEEIIGIVEVKAHSTSNPQAPGMLKSHYAPRVPLRLGSFEQLIPELFSTRVGILAFQNEVAQIAPNRQIILSPTGNLEVAAQRLFAALRELDQMDIDLILAEPVPEEGLGRAINDRLRRASAK